MLEAQIWGFHKHAQAQPKKGVAYKIKWVYEDLAQKGKPLSATEHKWAEAIINGPTDQPTNQSPYQQTSHSYVIKSDLSINRPCNPSVCESDLPINRSHDPSVSESVSAIDGWINQLMRQVGSTDRLNNQPITYNRVACALQNLYLGSQSSIF